MAKSKVWNFSGPGPIRSQIPNFVSPGPSWSRISKLFSSWSYPRFLNFLPDCPAPGPIGFGPWIADSDQSRSISGLVFSITVHFWLSSSFLCLTKKYNLFRKFYICMNYRKCLEVIFDEKNCWDMIKSCKTCQNRLFFA